MWLLHTMHMELVEFHDDDLPEYAILSHTWAHSELLFHQLEHLDDVLETSAARLKVLSFCEKAKMLGFEWAWMDSCCVDKRSSAHLTESINSMFNYYRGASICLIHLADVQTIPHSRVDRQQQYAQLIRDSRYFSRGWTLQEMIACTKRMFFTGDWDVIAAEDLAESIVSPCSFVTGIPERILEDNSRLEDICVAERMSWAARRQTTRLEDRAYSLMGIFGVNMAILYGEGLQGAFRRLQDEIMKKSSDQTLFAWRGPYKYSGLLAQTPDDFADTPPLGLWAPAMLAPYTMTNMGLHMRLYFWTNSPPDCYRIGLQCDVKDVDGWKILGIRLQRTENVFCVINNKKIEVFRRVDCDIWDAIPSDLMVRDYGAFGDAIISQDGHYSLVERMLDEDHSRVTEDNYGTSLNIMKLGLPSKPWRIQGDQFNRDGSPYYEV